MKRHELTCQDSGPDFLMARLSVAAPDTASGEFMYMPAGRHEINCLLNGTQRITSQVEVNAAAADALNRQLAQLRAKSAHRPYFDFNHEDREASFWPEGFSWKESPAPGIYARGEWSSAGKSAVEGKTFRTFSGVFHVDNPAAKPAHIICNPEARLNMGGLVNAPAFKANQPLWSKEAGAETNDPQTAMQKTLAELQAKLQSLETEIATLKTKAGTDAAAAAQLSARESEAELTRERIKNAGLENEIKARNTKVAEVAIQAAIKRGAIPAQNKEISARYQSLIEADPANIVLLEALPDNPALGGTRVTTGSDPDGGRIQAKEGPARILKAYGELATKNSRFAPDMIGFQKKGEASREMAVIYAKEIRPIMSVVRDMPLSAADNTDANLGVLTGTLVAQRCLDLFKLQFPMISRIYTDFSDVPAEFNQTTTTRIIVVPAVQTYNTALDAAGRPKGWDTVVAAQTTDVPITLDEHVGIPIVFDSNLLASTQRRLFDEQAPAASYALAKYFVEKIYHLITPAHFNGYANVSGQKVPVAYPTYNVALGDFGRSSLVKIATIFNPNEVPVGDRTVLLNSGYYGQLATDPSLVTFFAGQRAPEIITDNELPKLGTFVPMEAPNLANGNGTANLVGFAMHKAGLVAKTRLPNDYSQVLPGASYGSVTTITDPDIGISVVLVQYVNHTQGYAEWRIQVFMGAAVGDKRGGLVIKSQ